MAVQTMQVTTGEHQNVRVMIEDLELLKKLKRDDEVNLAVTFHRVLTTYEMYDAISKAGNFVRITEEAQTNA